MKKIIVNIICAFLSLIASVYAFIYGSAKAAMTSFGYELTKNEVIIGWVAFLLSVIFFLGFILLLIQSIVDIKNYRKK